jgi:hypothetical protein
MFPAMLVLYIRYYLNKENERRDELVASGKEIQETGIVESTTVDGHHVDHAADNNQLDLTDRENLTFRYVL